MPTSKRLFIAILTSLLLIGFVATSLISYYVAKGSIQDHLEEQMLPLTSDNIYSEIQRDLLQPVLISSLMANDTFVRDWVHDGEQDPERMANYLARIQQKYETISAFYVSEKTRLYYHPSGVIRRVDRSEPADAWFFRSRKLNDDYEINVDRDTADPSRLTIFVNYQAIDQNGELMGITGVGLSTATVASLIERYQKRYGRKIYFVNREGDVTLHSSDFEGATHLQNKDGLDHLSTRILTSPSSSIAYDTKDGNTVYLNSRLIPEFDWFLIVEQVNDPASERVEGALLVNVLVSVGISLLVLLIAYFTLGGYQRRLENMATRDNLTGAASRQVFGSIFWHAVKVCDRRNSAISLIAIDIDNFKEINDTYGHQKGDDVIRTTADIIKGQVRGSDVLCRWGGEEFLLLMEDCDLKCATTVAEKIRRAVRNYDFTFADERRVLTISLGVAERRKDEAKDALVGRADQALYRSKRQGRDRVSQG